MLPRSSHQRIERESIRGRVGGRTQEIQRLIGRSLRTVVDFRLLGERTIIIEPFIDTDWERVRALVDRYQDLHLGGTDAGVIAIAERLGSTRLATLDHRHYRVVRPNHCDAFQLLP
jgi:predicted nucleic acid-binding protein